MSEGVIFILISPEIFVINGNVLIVCKSESFIYIVGWFKVAQALQRRPPFFKEKFWQEIKFLVSHIVQDVKFGPKPDIVSNLNLKNGLIKLIFKK